MADKDKQPQQKDFDKAWENIKAGKTMPTENDMGPLPKKEKIPTTQEIYDALMPKPNDPRVKNAPIEYKKKGGMIKKMASGGKVSQLAKANGIAVRGKSRGKIC